jgi:EAL domain-containing protein (putative c-di-GMP-specific phosphodiesterase class I)
MLARASSAEEFSQASYRGTTLGSSFQPILAVAQSRVARVEALLRAHDARGFNIAPLDLFQQAERFGEAQALDQLAHETHLARFAELSHDNRWLFLNCRPETLMPGKDGRSQLEITVAAFGYQPSEIVIEVLEQASYSHEAMTMAIAEHQANGFQVAIDDFGIGSSNFDRVWGVKPDFVKLDRSLIQRAALSRNDRRVAKMLVSMMHRMGVMVIAEGVETAEEALSIMDADVDFVQGFQFATPNTELDGAITQSESILKGLWPHLFDLVHRVGDQEQAHIAAVRSMLLSAVRALEAGADMAKAGQLFFAAPNTLSLFLVDAKGFQVGQAQHRQAISPEVLHRIRPMVFDTGANWSRRAYFKDAIRRPGRPSIHGPHRSMVEGAFIYTTAITLEIDERIHVLCGNFRMDERELNVPGVMTDNI